ncbi:putative ribonuclease H-like domain-containing protein [Tanacetum coccineum]
MIEVAFCTFCLLTSILTWPLPLLWCSHNKISSSSLSLVPIIPTSVPVLIIRPPLVSNIFLLLKSSILDSISGQMVGHAHSTLKSSGFRGSNMWLDLRSQTPNVVVATLVLWGQYSSISNFLKSSQGWAIAAVRPQDQQVVSELVALRNFAKKTWIKTQYISWQHQKCLCSNQMGIPNEHQLKFNYIKDAKSLLQAVEKRFGENVATKKTQRNLLKKQYENFTASSSEVLDQTIDRLQKLIRQLEIHGESFSQEDLNQKFLRSLSPKWNTHTIVWRNKPEIDILSMDDLYNNLKIYEPEVDKTSSSSTQNVAFVSVNSSTNGVVNTAYGVTTTSTQATTVNSTTIDNLSDAIISRLKVADVYANNEGKEILEEHWKEVFCEWAPRNQENRNMEITRRVMPVETTTSNALVSCEGSGYDWSDQVEEGLESVEARLLVYKKNESVYEEDICETKDHLSSDCLGYHAVPHPYIGNFMPPKPDFSFSGLEEFTSEPIVIKPIAENSEAKASEAKPKEVRKNNGAPIIEDWVSDNEEDDVPQAKIEKKTFKPSFAKIEFVKPKQQEKTARKTVNHVDYKKNIVPRAVLMKSGLVSVNTTRQVNAAHTKITVNAARPMPYLFKIAHSTDKNSNTARPKEVVNVARPKAVVNAVKGNNVNVVKTSACWVWKPKNKVLDHGNPQMDLQDQGVIDSGCSRHMTENMFYLIDYEEIDGGYVAFGGNPKGGKITSIVPRKNNMYSVDLKNVVPKGGLTFLFLKATSDESKLWHRRIGHINFKTMNKQGKQHRASCKSKTVSSISQPLHMLHMDLFGPTFVKSLMKKMYCLVVTDDYSRFSLVFLLAIKDETSGILKSFITRVENLIDQKVKVIRCDNGTEFKNKEMNQFCERKGIKKEFSVARTPQQNGVAERKNRTLIKAARIMLVDSKLPNTFWAEAVNTACYMQNRVLVTKPHNKTPYELFLGRKPALGFMRPFGCPITILNTIDQLGKFDGKANEGFFVSETTPNITRSGPNWLFDIDALTKSMNYKPVVVGNQSNGNAGTKACDDSTPNDGSKPSSDDGKKVDENPSKVNDQEKTDDVNSSNKVNVVSINEVNVVGAKISIELPDDPNMPHLEDIIYLDDDEDVGVEADMDNLDAFIPVSPIPTTREEPKKKRAIGTKWVFRNKKDEKGIVIKNKAILVAQGYTQEEGINYDEVFAPIARIEAIRLFLAYASFKGFVVYQMNFKSAFLYGKIEEEVYVCQPPGFEDPDYPNRIDKTLFIRRDKGDILLVQVYVDDIIFGSTKKSLCTEFEKIMYKKFQMSSMGKLTFFLGLQVKQKEDGIFISQDKYVSEIMKKFGFTDVKTVSTPMETKKPVLKDEDGEEVDVHLYRSMIGSLMYLTSLRPYIMFAVCACARYQVNPKVSHLYAIKRIFRYLKGQPKLGLWYPKDSPFDLVAYTYSDYVGASLDRKSTTGGCQFLGSRLISWQCKKQTVVANSTTEAEYVAASSCYGQVLWIQNQLLDYGYNFLHTKIFIDNNSSICIIKNPVFHSKTKHIEIRHHFIRDCSEKKLIQMVKIYTDTNVADLLTKAFIVSRFQFLIASIGMLNL